MTATYYLYNGYCLRSNLYKITKLCVVYTVFCDSDIVQNDADAFFFFFFSFFSIRFYNMPSNHDIRNENHYIFDQYSCIVFLVFSAAAFYSPVFRLKCSSLRRTNNE